MKGFLIAFSIFIVWSFFGLWLYSSFKTNYEIARTSSEVLEDTKFPPKSIIIEKTNTSNKTATTVVPTTETESAPHEKKPKLSGLTTLTLKGDTLFKFDQGVSIIKNSSELFIPESIIDFKSRVKDYLLEHPDKEVHINSIYSPFEKAEIPNLGIKRGNKVTDILVSAGVPVEKIVVKSVIKDIAFNEVGGYRNSISIRFKELNKTRIQEFNNTRIQELSKEPVKKNDPTLPPARNVYPEFSHAGIIINQNARELLLELKQIIKKHPEVKVELVGHTDRVGSAIDNLETGLQYAKQLKLYLVIEGGIENMRIKCSSKGESQPLKTAQNGTNMLANRRIAVVFY